MLILCFDSNFTIILSLAKLLCTLILYFNQGLKWNEISAKFRWRWTCGNNTWGKSLSSLKFQISPIFEACQRHMRNFTAFCDIRQNEKKWPINRICTEIFIGECVQALARTWAPYMHDCCRFCHMRKNVGFKFSINLFAHIIFHKQQNLSTVFSRLSAFPEIPPLPQLSSKSHESIIGVWEENNTKR